MTYLCDCERRYSTLDALMACQNSNHGLRPAVTDLAEKVRLLQKEVELWKDRTAALQRDFDATLNAACPHCGQRQ